MRAQGAAPEGSLAAHPSGGGSINGNTGEHSAAPAAAVVDSDELLERSIESALGVVIRAPDAAARLSAWRLMLQLIRSRSSERIEQLEAERLRRARGGRIS